MTRRQTITGDNTMQATANHGFIAKKHFGVMDGEKQIELLLTTDDELIQIVNGKWNGLQPGPGMTPEQTFDASRAHVGSVANPVDFC